MTETPNPQLLQRQANMAKARAKAAENRAKRAAEAEFAPAGPPKVIQADKGVDLAQQFRHSHQSPSHLPRNISPSSDTANDAPLPLVSPMPAGLISNEPDAATYIARGITELAVMCVEFAKYHNGSACMGCHDLLVRARESMLTGHGPGKR